MTRETNVYQMWPERDNIYYLRSADYSALQAALDNPPEPNEKLRTLLWSDNLRPPVRPIPDEHLNAIFGVDLYQSLEDQARIAEIVAELDAADAQLRRLQRAVLWFCYFAAVFAGCVFAVQLGRGAL
jgi:uncharacterized protein (DUF1778 family)